MILSLIRRMMPRDENFVALFAAHAVCIAEGAVALRALFAAGSEEARATALADVSAAETAADERTRETHLALRRAFIVPFDRSDIRRLITRMDDTIDGMEEVAQDLVDYGIAEPTQEMLRQVDSIVRCGEILAEALPLMANMQGNATRLSALRSELTRLEHEADETLREGTKRVRADQDLDAPITRRELYNHRLLLKLESVIDLFRNTADVVEGIVVEQV